MRVSVLKHSLALLLAALLLFGGTTKDVLHAWTGHRDTVHEHRSDGSLAFESKHHHCDFLSFFLTPFVAEGSTFTIREVPPVYSVCKEATIHLWETRSRCFLAGRGPPQLVVFA